MTNSNSPAYMPGPHGLAVLGLTVLSTSAGGALVAVLNFMAQIKTLKPTAMWPLLTGTGILGAGLVLTVCAAIAAYLSELAYSQGQNNVLPWWIAFMTTILSVVALATGLGWSFLGVVVQMT